jgi:hypothetical protein
MVPAMFHRCLLCVALSFVGTSFSWADRPSLLRIFGGAGKASAKPIENGSFDLSEEDGPWMILAATLVGENSRQRAERLVQEIRNEIGLPAFLYREKFDFTGNLNAGKRANQPRMRYANQYQYEAYAVLVGEYDSVENRNLDKDLETIRTANPAVFQDPNEVAAETSTDTPVTVVNAIRKRLMKAGKDKTKGPMANAFVTRNPLLPEEFFDAPEVDSFVYQLNSDKEYSLLECDGKYTVVVRTFEGLETVVDGRNDKKFVPSMRRLDQFAADAARMAASLRAKGEEAYQFHDRFKSIVTVGSFDDLGRELPDGGFEYSSEIRRVMQKYSALNAEVARSVPGRQGVAANHVAMIPFDVKPAPIAVPKPTKRSLYSAAFGRR